MKLTRDVDDLRYEELHVRSYVQHNGLRSREYATFTMVNVNLVMDSSSVSVASHDLSM